MELDRLLITAADIDEDGEVENCPLEILRQAWELSKGLGLSLSDMFSRTNSKGGPAWWLLSEEILEVTHPDEGETLRALCGSDFLIRWGKFQEDNPRTRAHVARAHITRDEILYGTFDPEGQVVVGQADLPPTDMFCTSMSWSIYSEAAYLHRKHGRPLVVLEEEAKWKHFRRVLQYADRGRRAAFLEW
jgi:hypothetical protein